MEDPGINSFDCGRSDVQTLSQTFSFYKEGHDVFYGAFEFMGGRGILFRLLFRKAILLYFCCFLDSYGAYLVL
jgi:hypothetical protein